MINKTTNKYNPDVRERAVRVSCGNAFAEGFGTRVLISGMRKGITPILAKLLRRRSVIEAEIGHVKTDGRQTRCPLKGTTGDAIFAVLCACGHNVRKILAHHLRAILALFIAAMLSALGPHPTDQIMPETA